RRGLAERQPVGRDRDAHLRAGLLRTRCRPAAGVQPGSAGALRETSRGCRDPAGRGHRRRRARAACRWCGMIDFRMPSLGADMEDGLLVEWMVGPGDRVERGQVVCAVETQKGAVDVEIWDAGVVEQLIAEPGQRIPVGGVLARIRGAEATSPAPSPAQEPVVKPAAAPAGPARTAVATASRGKRMRISPAARQCARELGIDPATLQPGPDGVIHLADVDTAQRAPRRASASQTSADDRRVAMRAAIASAMTRANRDIPHYYLGCLINVEAALRWLQARNETVPVADRALFAALQLRAVALALQEFPDFN